MIVFIKINFDSKKKKLYSKAIYISTIIHPLTVARRGIGLA